MDKDSAFRRALHSGGAGLEDDELFDLVLGAKPTALTSDLPSLLRADPLELVEQGHLSEQAAAKLIAARELFRRGAHRRDERPRLTTASAVFSWVRARFDGQRRETFAVLCLDPRSRLLRETTVAEGSVDSCHVDPREVFAPALACRASGIVLVHNHPSGDPEPSLHDVALTQQLRAGAEVLCLRLVDHVVVTDKGFVSMMQRRLLEGAPPGQRLQ